LLIIGLLALFLLVTGFAVIAYYQENMVNCASSANACSSVIFDRFGQFIRSLHVQDVLQIIPALVGFFIGAPLVAWEVERGTYLLAWTQGITRQRWLAVKLLVLAAVTLGVFLLLELLVAWWNGPVVSALGPFTDFDVSGVVPLAYALFALVLGITAGTVVRNSVGAIAITLALFAGLRLIVHQLRPSFLPSLSAVLPDGQLGTYRRDWIFYLQIMDRQGQAIGHNPCAASSTQADCFQTYGLQTLINYHPAGQFWAFQGIESAIFLLFTAGLCALMFWWVQHRVH
jgi:ABC-type transport system involved in multi-copper enzyme maturation permease subunit